MAILNLTPHSINFDGGITIPPSGHVARLQLDHVDAGSVDGIPVLARRPGGLTGLPDNLPPGSKVIVSAQCVDALLAHRRDLWVYTVGPTSRGPDGAVTTCGLVQNLPPVDWVDVVDPN
jgi:hypothetical protein